MAEPVLNDARQVVLRRLAVRADYWAEQEQLLVQEGKYVEAEGAHQFGLMCLKAYKVECDDPDPKEVDE